MFSFHRHFGQTLPLRGLCREGQAHRILSRNLNLSASYVQTVRTRDKCGLRVDEWMKQTAPLRRPNFRFYSQSQSTSQSVEKGVEQGEGQDSQRGGDKEQEEVDLYDLGEGGLELTEEEIQHLSQGDPEVEKRIKYIQLEHAVLMQEGSKVPSRIEMKHWEELIHLGSKSRRLRFYSYLFKTEMSKLNRERKKREKQEERLRRFAEDPIPTREEDQYGVVYALSRNCLHLRLYDTTVNRFHHCRVASAMVHHPPLVIDCSYDEHMSFREAKNCAKQLELLLQSNRTHKEPYNMYFCNLAEKSNTKKYLKRMIPTLEDDSYPLNVHSCSFMDLFPKEKLVYLTPHTRDDLDEYNEDDIYIIGAMVDKTDPRPYSLAKAKKLGLRMKRLPLDQYLMWGLGGKSLTLDQMVKIMLDVRYTRGDWKAALKHVPMRKLCRQFHPYPEQVQEQSEAGETSSPGNQQMEPLSPPLMFHQRKERKSLVYEDYDLLNRRKGFRRSDSFNKYPMRDARPTPPKMRSLLHDDD